MSKPLFTGEVWTVEDIEKFWSEIDSIGKDWGLTYPDMQIEIVSADQMIEIISTIGMPCSYDHWSIGRNSIEMKKEYNKGQSGLALELIINSDPCIMYIMENNTLIQQGLVLAHAGLGHGTVFKNNYLFKQWTDAEGILEYFKFAKDYIHQCEMLYNKEEVEALVDICRSLQDYAISHKKQKRPKHYEHLIESLITENQSAEDNINNKTYKQSIKERIKYLENKLEDKSGNKIMEFPEENILYFIEKFGAHLSGWHREVIRIHRKIAEYFYPQIRTKILHEGWASFIQMRIFEELYKRNVIDEGGYLEFLRNHVNVTYQPEHTSSHYNGTLNPYAIGSAIFEDLYRMTHSPTKEDCREYPEICNTDWKESLISIVQNYSDSDLIRQYLTKNVIDRYKLFAVDINAPTRHIEISGTARDIDIIRENYCKLVDPAYYSPRLEIDKIGEEDILHINAYCPEGMSSNMESLRDINSYIQALWKRPTIIEEIKEA